MCSTQKSSTSPKSWLALLAIGILLCTSSLAWGDNPNFPPPGRDSMPSTADVLVEIGPQTLDLHLLGERTGTIVQRGPRINPPGPPPPYPYIETEMLMLSLHSVSPTLGPVDLMLNPAAPPSLGRTTALQEPPDLPALSFFDVFVEIDLPMLGMRLVSGFPQQPGNPASIQPLPVRVVNESLRCVPPGPGERFCTPVPFSVPLTDLQTGQIVGQILRVWHTIIEPNHFKVWRVQPVPFVPPLTAVAKDQFGSNQLQLNQIDYLSNPVQKTVDGKIFNFFRPDDHLNWYHTNILTPTPPLSVLYKNQFESTTVIIDNLVYFCVPTRKFPHPAPQRMDHYTGYRIQNPKMIRKPVQLQDQFDVPSFESIDSLLPLFLLAPAQKNSEPVYDTVTHYVAYRIFPQDIDTRTVDTEDQFGIHAMNVQISEFLMVPTRKLGFTPAQEACCYTGPGGSLICALVPAGQCVPVFGGTVVAACLGDVNPPNGIDDACEQPPQDTVCCDSTIVPNCLVMCPESDVPYTITLKDCNGNPVGGHPATQMWLDFSMCPNVCPCPEQAVPPWPLVYPNGPSNALGQATWYVDAGFRCPNILPCLVKLCIVFNTPTGSDTCCYVIDRVTSTDINCNLVVENSDLIANPQCNDYNWNGTYDQLDQAFWLQHKGHHCVPCDQFREEIRFPDCDPHRLIPGDTCRVCLFILNNTPDTCYIDSLVLQQAGFNAVGGPWTTIGTLNFPPPIPCIPPGDSAQFYFQYIVPNLPGGHGCVRILKFSDCCNDTVQHNLDVDYDPYNCGRRCDTFRVPIQIPAGATYCVTPVENLPPGWTATYVPALPACFPAPGPGVIMVVICTDNNPVKGQIGCVTLIVTDPAGTVVGEATVCKKIACKLGDMNNDDILTSADVVQGLNLTFLNVEALNPRRCYDMNGDGILTAADVVIHLNCTFLNQCPPGCQ